MPLLVQFHQGLQVFPLLEMELQQQRQMLREDNPLWKYVTGEQGSGSKLKEGGNVAWKCNYCDNHFMSTYYHVKSLLLALPGCGIAACTQVPLAKRKEMEKKANVGMAKVAATSKKTRMMIPFHS